MSAGPVRRIPALAGRLMVGLAVVGAMIAVLPAPAEAATATVTPTGITTTAGSVGSGQTAASLGTQDQSGTQDTWTKYVEFAGAYTGYLTFAAPSGVTPSSVSGIQAKINYRGPLATTQGWTFKLKNWTTGAWTTIGSNATASDWGPWTVFTFNATGTISDLVSGTGALQLQLVASNSSDAADIDYAGLLLTYATGGDTTAPSGPAGLSVTAVTTSSVSLAWTASSDDVGVVGYDVYRGSTLATSVTGTTATVTGLAASTSYSFTVRARDAAGNTSVASGSVAATTATPADTTAPSSPAGVTVASVTTSSVSLTWSASSDDVGVVGYDVYQGSTVATTVTATSATVTGLAPDTTYGFTVRARDGAGNTSAASSTVTGHTAATTGGGSTTTLTPTSLTTSTGAIGSGQSVASLGTQDQSGTQDTWTKYVEFMGAYTGVLAYALPGGAPSAVTSIQVKVNYHGPDASTQLWTFKLKNWNTSTWTTVGATTTASDWGPWTVFTFTAAGVLTDYVSTTGALQLQVVAANANDNADIDYVALVVTSSSTPDTSAPTVPAGLTVSGVTPTSVSLAWTAATDNVGVTGYDVYQGAAVVAAVSGTTATISGLTASTAYTFAVRARDAAGNASSVSAGVNATTTAAPDTTAPSTPGGLTVTAVTTTTVSLAWSASTDNVAVVGYDVYRGGNQTPVASVTGLSATVTGLSAATAYTFTVKARDAAGNRSVASSSVPATTASTVDTTAPSAPTGVSVTATTTSAVSLAWTASTDNVAVTGYDIYADEETTPETSVTGTSATITGYEAATTIVFTVRAYDAAGNVSATSAPVRAVTATTVALPSVVSCAGCWHPSVVTSWNWVLAQIPAAPFRPVALYDIDGLDAEATDVAAIQATGATAVCYVSAGSREDWRDDAAQFPASILGAAVDGWVGENWLDVRDVRQPGSALATIMTNRIDQCHAKGFAAVEFDNVDAFLNVSGFPLTASDQAYYNAWLANQAHTRGMSAVLKNDIAQITLLLPYFDLALNEECFTRNECGAYDQFVQAGKPVFVADYSASPNFCTAMNAANLNGLGLSINLDDSVYQPCR